MGKNFKFENPAFKPPKAMMQLVDAFTDTYKPVPREEYADEIFPVRRLRDYFQAWPVPKMPDPLPPYLTELEKRGYPMQTGYDGLPALFCVRWKVRGEVCSVEETTDFRDDSHDMDDSIRTGLASMKALISRRMTERRQYSQYPDEEDEEGENSEDGGDDWGEE